MVQQQQQQLALEPGQLQRLAVHTQLQARQPRWAGPWWPWARPKALQLLEELVQQPRGEARRGVLAEQRLKQLQLLLPSWQRPEGCFLLASSMLPVGPTRHSCCLALQMPQLAGPRSFAAAHQRAHWKPAVLGPLLTLLHSPPSQAQCLWVSRTARRCLIVATASDGPTRCCALAGLLLAEAQRASERPASSVKRSATCQALRALRAWAW